MVIVIVWLHLPAISSRWDEMNTMGQFSAALNPLPHILERLLEPCWISSAPDVRWRHNIPNLVYDPLPRVSGDAALTHWCRF